MSDLINQPPHYKGFSNGAEVIDITENLIGNRANAVKYLCRAGRKADNDELADLKKAQWYVNHEIARVLKARFAEDGEKVKSAYTPAATYQATMRGYL